MPKVSQKGPPKMMRFHFVAFCFFPNFTKFALKRRSRSVFGSPGPPKSAPRAAEISQEHPVSARDLKTVLAKRVSSKKREKGKYPCAARTLVASITADLFFLDAPAPRTPPPPRSPGPPRTPRPLHPLIASALWLPFSLF